MINTKFILIVSLLFIPILFFNACKEESISPQLFGSIAGKVVDAETLQPIVGVSIVTSPATIALFSDAAGEFNIDDIPIGNFSITASKVGYDRITVTVAVREDQTTNATISMVKSPTGTVGKVTDPSPPDGEIDLERDISFSWQRPADDSSSVIKYDLFLYDANAIAPFKVASDLDDTTFSIEDLKYATTYFWQVDSKIGDTIKTEGDVWSFKTRAFPDYRFIFSSNRDGNYEIYTADTTTQDIIKLTDSPSKDWWPRMSPNRRKIAFSSDASIGYHIYIMDRDGSNAYRVTTLPIAGYHNNGIGFAWAPDGGSLIYSHYNKLYRIDENGSNLRLIATAPAGRHFRECDFSPIGDKILALTVGENPWDNEIYILNTDGSNFTLLVDNLPGIIEAPSFSIDGQNFIFTRDISGFESPDGRQLDTRVYSRSISDTTTTDLSANKIPGTNDSYPRFIPDGSKIILTNAVNDGFTPKNVIIINLVGDERNVILQNAEFPDWR